jgi:hypothetical protein
MVSNEMKSTIAQNCPGYEARYALSMLSMGSLSESCNNCSNYVRGQCIKDLLDPMREKIERN